MDKPSSATHTSKDDGQKKSETEGGGTSGPRTPKTADAEPEAEKRPSKQNSTVGEKLLSRAQTMLRAPTMSREQTKPGSSSIKDTVKVLQREKTRLEVTAEEDDEEDMKAFFDKMKTSKKKTASKEYTDSDFDTDLEDEPVAITPSHWGQKKLYQKTCKKLGLRPVPHVEENIESKEVVVLNRCLNALDVLAITNVLVSNQKVTKLVLDGNEIGNDGAKLLAWLMGEQDSFLEKVSIADNYIGREGFKAIGEMLQTNRQLTSLNISGNDAGLDDIEVIANALKMNHHLTHLNLSYSGIGDRGAKYLASMIAQNDGLTSLDLSWNKIQPQGGVALCHALRENVLLKTLNLGMNGLTNSGANYLGETLKKNESLTYLDITFNRIFDEGASHIAKGLEKNEKLHHLIMHNNPLTSAGAMALITAVRKNERTGMWKLDLSHLPVVKDVVASYDEYHEQNEGFEFRYGVVVDTLPSLTFNNNGMDMRNPMAKVREYIEEEGLRMMDFFKLMDKDHGGSISRAEFTEGLQNANVPMSVSQIEDLIEMLDKDGDGEIDYQELVSGDREFRRKKLRMKLRALEAMQNAIKPVKPEDSWVDS